MMLARPAQMRARLALGVLTMPQVPDSTRCPPAHGPSQDSTNDAAFFRAQRRAIGLTQQELADQTGVSIGMVRDLEQGRTTRPLSKSINQLSGALGLDYPPVGPPARPATAAPGITSRDDPLRRARASLVIEILGPVAAWRDGTAIGLGGPKQRAVLGLLALSPNVAVRVEALVDALWGEDCPATAVTVVQSYVSRLRHVLDPGRAPRDPGGLLVSTGGSYRLRVAPDQLDWLAFAGLVDKARAASVRGDKFAACDMFERALRLWRADPLADTDMLRYYPAVIGLRRAQASVICEFAQTAFDVGQHQRVLAHLHGLIEREPLHEKAHAQLMLALAHIGQQSAALLTFEDIRHRLRDQLGVSPGPELSGAHIKILRQEALAPSASPAQPGPLRTAAGQVPEVPRQLPAAVRHFVGRASELAALCALPDADDAAGGTMVISAIHGTAGIGKTALAVRFANLVAERYADGQLYVNLRGFDPCDPPLAASEVIRGFLEAFGLPAERTAASLDVLTGLYRSVVAGKRMLVLLDNARDAAQVRPLIPGGQSCLVLVTSRNRLTSLVAAEAAHSLTLGLLAQQEARELLVRRIGVKRVEAEPQAADELIELCAGLPLALSVIAARAAIQPTLRLAMLAAELREARVKLRALDPFDCGDPATSARAAFDCSYRNLSAAAARMFRLLGLHPGPDLSVAAAASLAGVTLHQALQAAAELIEANVLTGSAGGRLAFHDLLRAYAAERAQAEEGDRGCRAARCRALDHYLHTAHAAAQQLNPARDQLALTPPAAGVVPEMVADQRAALTWFEAEHRVLVAATRQAASDGLDAYAWQIPSAFGAFLVRRGHLHDWAATQQVAAAAAGRLGEVAGEADALLDLGHAHARLGSYDRADAELRQALRRYARLGDRFNQARVHNTFATVFERQGRHDKALGHARKALELCVAAGHRDGQANALNSVGWYSALTGNYHQALVYCHLALQLHRELGDPDGEASTWDSLAYAHRGLGDHAAAARCFQRALDLCQEIGATYCLSDILINLGDNHHAAGNIAAARAAWQRAVTILDDLHLPDATHIQARLDSLDHAHVAPTDHPSRVGPARAP
jgi:DNA-binding SARP family transcriptional activator/Tfp pilus assembly protein PilF